MVHLLAGHHVGDPSPTINWNKTIGVGARCTWQCKRWIFWLKKTKTHQMSFSNGISSGREMKRDSPETTPWFPPIYLITALLEEGSVFTCSSPLQWVTNTHQKLSLRRTEWEERKIMIIVFLWVSQTRETRWYKLRCLKKLTFIFLEEKREKIIQIAVKKQKLSLLLLCIFVQK